MDRDPPLRELPDGGMQRGPEAPGEEMPRGAFFVATAGLVALALVVRVALLWLVPVVTRDAAFHAGMALDLDLTRVDAWSTEYPGFALTVRWAWHLLGDPIAAVRAASLVPGALLVVPVVVGTARWFGRRAGFLAGGVVALHPYLARLSVDGLAEPLYLLLLVPTIGWAWRAVEEGSIARAVAASALGLGAGLVRPEGLGVCLAGAGAALVVGGGPDATWRRRLGLAAGFLAVPLLVAGVVAAVRAAGGASDLLPVRPHELNRVRGMLETAAGGPGAVAAGLAEVGRNLGWFLLRAPLDHHPVALGLWVVGLVAALRGEGASRRAGWWLGGLALLYLVGLSTVRYERRLSQQLLVILLPLTGRGGSAIACGLARSFGSTGRAWAAVGLVAALGLAPVTLRPHREEKVNHVRAGRWLAAEAPDARVAVTDRRVPFYAGGDLRERARVTSGPLDRRIRFYERLLEEGEVDLVILMDAEVEALGAPARPDLRLRISFPSAVSGEGRNLHVFRRVPVAGGDP